jgi:hypothetical protein
VSDPDAPSDYALAAREPALWLSNAPTLRRAAALVHKEFAEAVENGWQAHPLPEEQLHLMGPYMLLSGMAIENVLKGILILRRPHIASDLALSRKGWTGTARGGHALELMADEARRRSYLRSGTFFSASSCSWSGAVDIQFRSRPQPSPLKRRRMAGWLGNSCPRILR